ncbi:hypothetical protein [Acinetobacter bereziniae]|uniref:hypothetical protein n=1 Tax=Acinetobacter bereziniae TaxID=106648 RepID=UPI00073F9C43|nr:hypothetical protein [Acinetobacter bereziniae]RSZ23649.1 hypothetical protein NDM229_021270 [Acinetobacter bereziniae]
MKNIFIAGLSGLVLILSGCSVRMADLTVASTKNYNLNSNKFIKGERVVADDSVPVILFPLGIPNMKTAMDKAIEKNKCSVALTDVVITSLNQAFIVGKIGYRVEGTQVLDTSQPNCGKSSHLEDLSNEKPLILSNPKP